jgi:predicted acylesterase/phospholipase RssA
MNAKLPEIPFNTLALSMSGGGYRAAAFHLGSLTYLSSLMWNGTSLLERVRVISTVSGGTFTGVCYASTLAGNKSLMDCYWKLYQFMTDTDLIGESLKKLAEFDDWNSPKGRSLINAFSLVYLEKLENKTFSHLFDHPIHLKELIFNATEFNYGLPFRLQRSELGEQEYSYAFLGNRQVNMPPQAIREIRLADIIAASSCFPMGFEPINFPTDFRHDHSPVLDSLKESYKTDQWGNKCAFPIGLMDGGIVDNQGIDSVIQAEQVMKNYKGERRKFISNDEKAIDLYIISDVSSPFMDGYIRTEEKPLNFWRKLSFRKFSFFGLLSLLMAALTIILAVYSEIRVLTFVAGIFTAVFILAGILSFFLSQLFHKFMKIFEVPEFFASRLGIFSKMQFGIYETLIKNRISSVVSMVSEVFMKQIRRQQYGRVYNEPGWETRLIMNGIYELSPGHTVYRNSKKDILLSQELRNVSTLLMATAEKAKSMGTTLWFTPDELKGEKDNMLKTLIACGQYTICFNLIEYIEKIILNPKNRAAYDAYSDDLKVEINTLHTKMLNDWKAFNTDPYWMVKEIHQES